MELTLRDIIEKGLIPYLNLDKSIIELEEYKGNLEELSKKVGVYFKALERRNYWHEINGELYYFKSEIKMEKILNEILGSMIAEFIGLPTVKFQVAAYNEKGFRQYGLISKNFKLPELNYVSLSDLDLKTSSLDLKNLKRVKRYFEEKCDYNKFIVSMLNLSAHGFFSEQLDTVSSNITFIKESDNLKLAPLYDYVMSMGIGNSRNHPTFDYTCKIYPFYYKENEINEAYRYGNAFMELLFPSKEYYKLVEKYPEFYKCIIKLLDFDIDQSLKQIEENHPLILPRYIKSYYKNFIGRKKEQIMRNL